VGGKQDPSFKPTLFEHSERQTRSDPALAIARVLVTKDFKNTKKKIAKKQARCRVPTYPGLLPPKGRGTFHKILSQASSSFTCVLGSS